MAPERVILRAHALQRMFELRIEVEEVRAVLESGETIE